MEKYYDNEDATEQDDNDIINDKVVDDTKDNNKNTENNDN